MAKSYLDEGYVMRRLLYFTALGMIGAFLLPVASAGGKIISPDNIPGSVKVNAEGVIKLVESMPNVILIDSRIRNDRLQGFIEGSISLPDEETSCDSLGGIVPNKTHPALYYCNGPRCGRSANAIEIALGCGYSNIYWFRGGLEEWMTKDYPILRP